MPALKTASCRCLVCGRPYLAAPCRLRLGFDQHCSRRCACKSPLRHQLTRREQKAGYANAPSRIKSKVRSLYRAGKIAPGEPETDHYGIAVACLTAASDDLDF